MCKGYAKVRDYDERAKQTAQKLKECAELFSLLLASSPCAMCGTSSQFCLSVAVSNPSLFRSW